METIKINLNDIQNSKELEQKCKKFGIEVCTKKRPPRNFEGSFVEWRMGQGAKLAQNKLASVLFFNWMKENREKPNFLVRGEPSFVVKKGENNLPLSIFDDEGHFNVYISFQNANSISEFGRSFICNESDYYNERDVHVWSTRKGDEFEFIICGRHSDLRFTDPKKIHQKEKNKKAFYF